MSRMLLGSAHEQVRNRPAAGVAEFVQGQVDAGLYNSAADVIEDAVRRASEEIWPNAEAIRAALAPGVAEADAGVFYEGTIEDILAEARATRAKQR
ncbi:MAG TPA: type II toxin-antitoxin system ParD family antitoxin [Vitreimonas sp.]|uniref:ribbon-helix-helix domain-containing protein n=1 Tax=Vitreimonas sp. TaxID=3069702 RepID=UPI002D6CBAEE|nr:type II toxin-antitoxin system ParD family antitoxin [Vitreimonas sp.]HYD86173.1 type II toxin-antitoxin system ParD family antitoxin [Vitreimonas sp.]